MNKKIIVFIVIVGIIAIFAVLMGRGNRISENKNSQGVPENTPVVSTENQPEIKEFSMTSFVEMVDGNPKPQFSLKEIIVNKGDRVRLKITVTSGMHDFKIDEYGVYADTQPGKESVVEFTADKAGEFVYYCTKPGHRQNGHWGTLKVLD